MSPPGSNGRTGAEIAVENHKAVTSGSGRKAGILALSGGFRRALGQFYRDPKPDLVEHGVETVDAAPL